MTHSACGIHCDVCPFYNQNCDGYFKVKGKTFWAKDLLPDDVCTLFDCSVNSKQLHHCGECAELPCKKFYDLKDPDLSDEEHLQSINKRVQVLKG